MIRTSCSVLYSVTQLLTNNQITNNNCKAHARISRKMGNATPCKIVTRDNFSSNVCTRDYVGTATTVYILVKIGSVKASPQVGKIWKFWTVLSFFSRSWAQFEPFDRFPCFMAQMTCFRARKCLWGYKDR